jgi:hypothetical protein
MTSLNPLSRGERPHLEGDVWRVRVSKNGEGVFGKWSWESEWRTEGHDELETRGDSLTGGYDELEQVMV